LKKTNFDPGLVDVGYVVNDVALTQVLHREIQFFPCQHVSTSAPYSTLSARFRQRSILHYRLPYEEL
jgi:hypothetical protein